MLKRSLDWPSKEDGSLVRVMLVLRVHQLLSHKSATRVQKGPEDLIQTLVTIMKLASSSNLVQGANFILFV